LYTRPSNGSGADEELLASDQNKSMASWSSDGKYIVFGGLPAGGRGRRGTRGPDAEPRALWALPLTGERSPIPIVQTPFLLPGARLSADGRWIAYVSGESGRAEVYVAAFAARGGKTRISTAGGQSPRWRRDGREIFYRGLSPDARIMTASVNANASTFEVGAAQPLFSVQTGPGRYPYDVTADGQRFLVAVAGDRSAPPPPPQPLTVVVNWTAGLRR
jgi:dipeptidyl aminopeptidase/acylaminoacyl peptidase